MAAEETWTNSETSSGEEGQEDEETQETKEKGMLCLMAIEEREVRRGKEVMKETKMR